tara:strand:- start:958 stop:1059 length:102 start_codon:yes stop_codon:yes gene_type:complete
MIGAHGEGSRRIVESGGEERCAISAKFARGLGF